VIATSATPKVRLQVVRGPHAGKKIRVRGPAFVIGREADCQLRPNSDLVSRRHAVIELDGGSVTLRDLGSRNGTLRNDEPIADPTALCDGDRITVGPLLFAVSIVPRASAGEDPAESWEELEPPTPDPDVPLDAESLLREMSLTRGSG
jgi:pSer/pThr/pTyr-binding forkhead associated (FHA) protein